MKCSACGCVHSIIIDSRLRTTHNEMWRRRKCLSCGKKFTTHERVSIEIPKKYYNHPIEAA
jgi:transcriptional repressor NrdR